MKKRLHDMNLVSYIQKQGFYMRKLNYGDKLDLYNDRKENIYHIKEQVK